MSRGAREPLWGEPPWHPAPVVPRPELPDRTACAVVGGGFTGLAAAAALAVAGEEVHLFETARLGSGASGRSGGLALEGTAAGVLPGTESCLDALRALAKLSGGGFDLELDGCVELRHAATAHADATGSAWPDLEAGFLVPAETVAGGSVDPGRLLETLVREGLRLGVTFHEERSLRGWRRDGRVLHLDFGKEAVRAERVFLAAGGFLGRFAPTALRTALTLAIATAPLPASTRAELGLLGSRPFYTVDRPYLWGRTTEDGRLVLGAGLVFAEPDGLEALGLGHPEAQAALIRLEARTRGLHPALQEVEVTRRWAGPVSFRPGGVPIFGSWPGVPGLLAAGAFAGHGVALAVHLGRWAAASMRGERELPDWGALRG